MTTNSKLYKSREDKVIDGVCGGIGEYMKIDPIIIRILWAVMVFAYGTGVLAYIVCMIIIPERPKRFVTDEEFSSDYDGDYEPQSHDGGENNMNERSKMVFGIGLVAIGCFILVDRYLPWFDFGFIWPFLLIGAGLYFLVGKKG